MKYYYQLVLILTFSLTLNFSNAQKFHRSVKETLLASLDSGAVINSYTFSKDLRKIAFFKTVKGKQIAVINDYRGKPYDNVSIPEFSPDSKKFIYQAIQNNKAYWISSTQKGISIDSTSPIVAQRFSPDNRSIALILVKENKYAVSYNGKVGKYYDAIDQNSIVFSEDGSRVAYTATINNRQLNVFNDVEGQLYDKVGYPIISKNAQHIAYWAITGASSYAVFDNVRSLSYESVGDIGMSDNGEHFVFKAKNGKEWVAIHDQQTSKPQPEIYSVVISPDGRRYAYAMRSAPEKVEDEEFEYYVVVDGKKSEAYETVVDGSLKFTSDSKNFVYKVERHDQFYFVLNGKEGKRYSDVLHSTMAFSPDNSSFAYAVENDTKRFINENGVEGKRYEDIYAVFFTPDNKRVIYAAKADNKDLMVIDDNEGKSYDSLLGQGAIVFDAPNKFHYIATRANRIYLVEETIE